MARVGAAAGASVPAVKSAAAILSLAVAAIIATSGRASAEKWDLRPRWESGDDRWYSRALIEVDNEARDKFEDMLHWRGWNDREFVGPKIKQERGGRSYTWRSVTGPRIVVDVFVSPMNFEHIGALWLELPTWWDRDRQGVDDP